MVCPQSDKDEATAPARNKLSRRTAAWFPLKVGVRTLTAFTGKTIIVADSLWLVLYSSSRISYQ